MAEKIQEIPSSAVGLLPSKRVPNDPRFRNVTDEEEKRRIAKDIQFEALEGRTDSAIDAILRKEKVAETDVYDWVSQYPLSDEEYHSERKLRKAKEYGRLTLEVGGSMAPAYFVPGSGWTALGLRTLLAGAGAFAGSMVSETFDPTDNPYKTALYAGAGGAIGEPVSATFGLAGKGLSKIKGTAREGAKEAQLMLQKEGQTLTVGQAVDSPVASLLQNIAEANPIAKSTVENTVRKAHQFTEDAAQNFTDAIFKKLPVEETDTIIKNAVSNNLQLKKEYGRQLYSQLDDMVSEVVPNAEIPKKVAIDIKGEGQILDKDGNILLKEMIVNTPTRKQSVLVDITEAKNKARKLLETEEKGISTEQAKSQLNAFLQRGDKIPFEDAFLLRSDYLAMGRPIDELIKGRSKGIVDKLASELDTSIANAAGKIKDGKALEKYREANAFWKDEVSIFNNAIIKNIANKDAPAVANYVINNANETNLNVLRKAIGEDNWQMTKGQIAQQIIQESSDPVTGVLNGTKFINNLNKLNSMKKGEKFGKIFTDAESTGLTDLAKTLAMTERSTSGMGYKMVAVGSQAGAAYGIFANGATPGTIGILLTPSVMAKIVTSPKLVNWLVASEKYARIGKKKIASQLMYKAFNALSKAGGILATRERDPELDRMIPETQETADAGGDIR